MTRVAVDATDLPRLYPDTRPSPLWWGIAGLILIEATVFSAFIASYFYLRVVGGQWLSAEDYAPPLLWPSVNTALLLISSGSMYWAGKLIKRGRSTAMVIAIFVSVALAGVVLILRGFELKEVPFSWDDHAYGSMYWTLNGLHFTHVTASLLGTAVVGVLGAMGYFTQQRHLAVAVDSIYWYFVALIWVPVYFVLYWVPRMW